ncbi:hypothetical protein AB3M75_20840 [Serratia ureilytica]|uniref:hypothetical protein n=1 Tax=Serratia ureilytica TaxID=300181 RepID=UPI0037125B00
MERDSDYRAFLGLYVIRVYETEHKHQKSFAATDISHAVFGYLSYTYDRFQPSSGGLSDQK